MLSYDGHALPWAAHSPRRVGRARGERPEAAEHRRLILNAARTLFAARGVEAVSMHQIAQAAGVGQGTLYRRYGHKGELCMDLLGEDMQRFQDEVADYLAACPADAPALERLDGMLVRMVDFVEEKAELLTAVCDASSGERRFVQYLIPLYQWLHAALADVLSRAAASGELPPLDATYTADALLSALNPCLYQFQRLERGYTPAQILEGARRIYVEGLRPTARTSDE